MYKIVINNVKNTHEYEELVKIFLKLDEYDVRSEGSGDLVFEGTADKNKTKRQIFKTLASLTGKRPEWGIITGIRPVKLFGDLKRTLGSLEKASLEMKKKYLVSQEKTDLLEEIYSRQREVFGDAKKHSAGIYIGIPFCPSRCLYCAFTSNKADEKEIKKYLTALYREIDAVSEMMEKKGIYAESVYVGGGTPTVLSEKDLSELLGKIREKIYCHKTEEFTVEAGRPDTITPEKIRTIEKNGGTRISINPQSMKDETVKAIGRNHTSAEIREAVKCTEEISKLSINTDIIAGLPGEDVGDFSSTVEEILKLKVDNVTVHSLAVKRKSRLAEEDKEYHYSHGQIVKDMLKKADEILRNAGYSPYYLYRQKHMSGSLENLGYARPSHEGLYNIRIMDEHQMIIALGVGGISKAYDFDSRTLERVPNVNNYKIYIERIDEMIKRKQERLFEEDKGC